LAFHVNKGFLVTKSMDDAILPLIEKVIQLWKATKKEKETVLRETKMELAERLLLTFWPGPSADVNVISNPLGTTEAKCEFNQIR
jgi:hypothetical protein